jgi:hypothetical protein
VTKRVVSNVCVKLYHLARKMGTFFGKRSSMIGSREGNCSLICDLMALAAEVLT